ncbi:MAG: YceI family protein [Bacteroidetes bacterium]|nr:YceI family protein [Bacteroidota bacterium]
MKSRFNLRPLLTPSSGPGTAFFWGLLLMTASASTSLGQTSGKYMTRTGYANFVADGIIKDDVAAKTNTVTAVLDPNTGQVQVRIPINSFVFRKALMQEHFNENYLQSHQFPFANFKGQVADWDASMMQKSGIQKIKFIGKLEIHGISKDVVEPGTMELSGGQIRMATDLMITVADYGIKIPTLVRDKIAKEAAVHVEVHLKPSGQ